MCHDGPFLARRTDVDVGIFVGPSQLPTPNSQLPLMTIRARWTAWCDGVDCKARIGQERSVSDATVFATRSGWLVQGGRLFCPEHHDQAMATEYRRPSPKMNAIAALITQRPGLGARELAEILDGRRVSSIRVNQICSLLRGALLRGLVVREGRGRWHPAPGAAGVAGADAVGEKTGDAVDEKAGTAKDGNDATSHV